MAQILARHLRLGSVRSDYRSKRKALSTDLRQRAPLWVLEEQPAFVAQWQSRRLASRAVFSLGRQRGVRRAAGGAGARGRRHIGLPPTPRAKPGRVVRVGGRRDRGAGRRGCPAIRRGQAWRDRRRDACCVEGGARDQSESSAGRDVTANASRSRPEVGATATRGSSGFCGDARQCSSPRVQARCRRVCTTVRSARARCRPQLWRRTCPRRRERSSSTSC